MSISSTFLFSQDANLDKNYLWRVGVHSGSSLIWGDLSDNNNPLSKMFSNESKLSYELDFNRKLSEVFSVEGSFLFGKLTGVRSIWSDKKDADLTFLTKFYDYNIGVNADITALFGAKPDRLISVYILGGIGMTNYKAVKSVASTGQTLNSANGQALIIPWGWGMSFNLTPRFSIFAQNTFRNTFVDDIDAHIGSGTKVNDIYSFTSVGASYLFGSKKDKKPQLELVPINNNDTTIAQVEEYIPVNVSTSVDIPTYIKPNEFKTVNVILNKGDLNSAAEFNQTFPDGFIVENIKNSNGDFSFEQGKLVYKWANLPSDTQISIAYKIKAGNIIGESFNIPGTLVYKEKGKINVKQFKNQILIENIVSGTDIVGVQDKIENTPSKTDKSGIFYAVQVAAVYGGKMNPAAIQKQYKLNDLVSESEYKGYNNYTIGNYSDYSSAEERINGTKVNGAYVVVFKDGKYLPHLYDVNQDIMDKTPFNENGLTYKVQISASNNRPYPIIKLANKLKVNANEIYEEKVNIWYQYSFGKFNSLSDAKTYVAKAKALGISDAFVVIFENGKRIK
ncbi:MAG: hypothetical protein AUJ98_02760 [Bacteroidetes bacterium CG2_30_33_31]|nr:MAG: hypothetical protein AUJ98_02760 [Bacteroidetes bacterium CG2_30_33_31]